MKAKLAPRVALQRLIDNTGLHARQINAKIVVLEPSAPAASPVADTREPNSGTPRATGVPTPGLAALQEAPPMAEVDPEIVVTGTHIRGATSSSPATVTTRKSLENAGITDMTGFARILLENFSGGQNPGVAGGGDQGGQSNLNDSTTLNLRGLGPDATLTLINGHRVAYDALNQGVDISTIPLAAIDRVEVVADGASALYGSDAVGGVANIVLRKDYSGGQISARYGGATSGGDVQQQYTGITGARWVSGGFMVTADYSRGTAIDASDRNYTHNLDGSQTLLSRQSKISAIVSGHEAISDAVSLELDAQFSDRRSRKATPYTVTADASTNGIINDPHVRTYAVTPALRLALPSDWQASLQATRSVSRTAIYSHRYTGGIEAPSRLVYQNRLTNLEASAEGPLWHLPGGDVRLALGGGYRRFGLDIDVSQTSAGVTSTTQNSTEQRESLFAYGELAVPIVGAGNRSRFVYDLHLSGAVRYERYAGIDQVATPKFGLVYAPSRDVTFKASWGRSFKIPTLNQVNEVQQGSLLSASLFSPQPSPALPAGSTVLLLGGGNPDLKAERARSWTTTLEIRPAPGLELTATYFNVDYRQRIAAPVTSVLSSLTNSSYQDFVTFSPSAAQVLSIIESLPEGLSNQSGQPFDASDVAVIIDDRLRNTERERVHGLDFSGQYDIDSRDAGHFTITAGVSYLDASRRLSSAQGEVDQAGVIFTPPHWRARGGVDWERGKTQVSAFLNYLGSVEDNRFATPSTISAFTTLDLSARIRTWRKVGLLHDIEFRFSADNVLNEKPDLIATSDPASIPYDSTNQSAIGRFLSLAVSASW